MKPALRLRTKDDPPDGGGGRSRDGKMPVAGAVEIVGNGPGRVRLSPSTIIPPTSLHAFIQTNIAAGVTAKTDGWAAYPGAPKRQPRAACHRHNGRPHRPPLDPSRLLQPQNLGTRRLSRPAPHLTCSPTSTNSSSASTAAAHRHAAFRTLLGIGMKIKPATYKMLIAPEASG